MEASIADQPVELVTNKCRSAPAVQVHGGGSVQLEFGGNETVRPLDVIRKFRGMPSWGLGG